LCHRFGRLHHRFCGLCHRFLGGWHSHWMAFGLDGIRTVSGWDGIRTDFWGDGIRTGWHSDRMAFGPICRGMAFGPIFGGMAFARMAFGPDAVKVSISITPCPLILHSLTMDGLPDPRLLLLGHLHIRPNHCCRQIVDWPMLPRGREEAEGSKRRLIQH
jgi:hypothetical protein